MAIICPAVLAGEPHEFREQLELIAPFTTRVHIDLMDGEFAPTKSVAIEQIWWPHHMQADIHLMYQRPADYLDALISLNPRMVLIHSEADVDFKAFAAKLHDNGILAGLSLLANTSVDDAASYIDDFDHVMVFSGDLGRFGGNADLSLLEKVKKAKASYPDLEIGWDGGVNAENARVLVDGGVDVLNVGGFIQKAENPADAYAKLEAVL